MTQQGMVGTQNPFVPSTPMERTSIRPGSNMTGCVLGIALARTADPTAPTAFYLLPGDDVEITYPSAGTPPKPLSAKFTVVDFYESKMNEYDRTSPSCRSANCKSCAE